MVVFPHHDDVLLIPQPGNCWTGTQLGFYDISTDDICQSLDCNVLPHLAQQFLKGGDIGHDEAVAGKLPTDCLSLWNREDPST